METMTEIALRGTGEHVVFIPIQLRRGSTNWGRTVEETFVIQIDKANYNLFNQYKWRGMQHGRSKKYVITKPFTDGKVEYILLHRLIMGAKKGEEVDHVNGDTTDFRVKNLRLCNKFENNRNKEKTKNGTSSKYKGVCWDRSRFKWLASITTGSRGSHKTIYLGRYSKEIEAAKAYDEAARKLHGEFACVNFPLEGERSAI